MNPGWITTGVGPDRVRACSVVLNAWWVDGVTSLAIVAFLIKEGREALEPEEEFLRRRSARRVIDASP